MLQYSIVKQWLSGSVGSKEFSMQAWSGGGRGRTSGVAEASFDSYNEFRKKKTGVRGGPLPPGHYICKHVEHHKTFGECIFLEQTITSLLSIDGSANIAFYDRDGFFIHGRGPQGSDGCIVPDDKKERLALNKAIRAAKDIVLLKVVEPGVPLPASNPPANGSANA